CIFLSFQLSRQCCFFNCFNGVYPSLLLLSQFLFGSLFFLLFLQCQRLQICNGILLGLFLGSRQLLCLLYRILTGFFGCCLGQSKRLLLLLLQSQCFCLFDGIRTRLFL